MPTDDNQVRFTANYILSNRKIILKNFLGGLAWGFGSVLGATIVVALLVGFLKTVNVIPVIGEFTSQIVEIVNQKQNFGRDYIDE